MNRELWEVWLDALNYVDGPAKQACLSSACELALSTGECDIAVSVASQLWSMDPTDLHHATWLLGRAQLAASDVGAARVTLLDAAELSPMKALRLKSLAYAAEAAYFDGDRVSALTMVDEVLKEEVDRVTRLQARNVLGKVFLAEGRWDEAEAHFAQDETAQGFSVSQGIRIEIERKGRLICVELSRCPSSSSHSAALSQVA